MIPTSLTPTMREMMAMVIRYGEFSLDVVVAFLYWWLTSGKVKPYLEVKFVADNLITLSKICSENLSLEQYQL